MAFETFEKPGSVETESRHRSRVLFVGENAELVTRLAPDLDERGLAITVAERGQDALDAAASGISLILLDMRHTDAGQTATYEQLARSPRTNRIPMIVFSAMTRPDIIRRSHALGVHYFVRTPIEPEALLPLIQQALCEASI